MKVVPNSVPVGDIYENCVESCQNLKDGNYPSCHSCDVFVTCSNEDIVDDRPCPGETIWNHEKKSCEEPMKDMDCGGKLYLGEYCFLQI